MKSIGVGVIGWGFMGKTHTHALRSIPLFYPDCGFQVELKCVCARHRENAAAAARDAGFERFTDDYRALLAMDDIDVVSVCTPNDQHEEMVLAALEAGKHVYVDKPLAVTEESARRMAEAAGSAGVSTRVVFNNRYFPATLRAKELVDAGAVGELLQYNARYLHSGSIDPNRPAGWKQRGQGGVMLDLGSHALDLMVWLAGWPKKVLCETRRLYDARPTADGGTARDLTEDYALALMSLENGAIGTMEASKIATGAEDELCFELRGTRGALKWNSMDPNYLDFFDNTLPEAPYGGSRGFTRIQTVQRYPAPGGKLMPPKASIGWERGHTHCYFTFLDAIARGLPAENGLEEAARLQALMARMLESDARGEWVEARLD